MNIAIIEANHWHVPLYLDAIQASGRIVAVSDRTATVGKELADLFGCSFYQSHTELLSRHKIDFAFAFGRHIDMPGIGEALIEKQVPFSIEKPCGTSAAEVAGLRKRAEKAGIYVAVPFILRCSDLVQRLRETEGSLPSQFHHGAFRFIVGPASRYIESGCPWMLDRSLSGGGCTINVGTHFVDLFRTLTGSEVKSVTAAMSNYGGVGSIEDYSVMTMTAANGSVGVVETGYGFPMKKNAKREFALTLSSSSHYYHTSDTGLVVISRTSEVGEGKDMPMSLDTDPCYAVYVDRILDDFQAGRPPIAGLADAEAMMRVLDGAYLSAASGGQPQAVS